MVRYGCYIIHISELDMAKAIFGFKKTLKVTQFLLSLLRSENIIAHIFVLGVFKQKMA